MLQDLRKNQNLVEEEESNSLQYLTFFVKKEEYAVNIANVIEIVEMQRITHVPDLPDYVKGVINLRGNVYAVIDVRFRFGLEEIPYDQNTCIIIINIASVSVGLIVDNVSEVIEIPEDRIDTNPALKKSEMNRFISGLGKINEKVLIILDAEKLLQVNEIEQLQNIEA